MVCKCAGNLARILHPHLHDKPIMTLLLPILHRATSRCRRDKALGERRACMVDALSINVQMRMAQSLPSTHCKTSVSNPSSQDLHAL